MGRQQRYYAIEEEVPIERVLKTGWREILIEKDNKGAERINRINYEISVLQALRGGLQKLMSNILPTKH
jgi:hypothetical protein